LPEDVALITATIPRERIVWRRRRRRSPRNVKKHLRERKLMA